MRVVKIEFQENNNGLHFLRRPSFFMGIFFYACHYQMTDSLSFRNESYRFIFDLWVINGRQNYRFEMIAPCPFDMMIDALFEMMMAISSKGWLLSFRKDDCCLFEMTRTVASKWWIDCHFEMIDDSLFERLMAFASTWRWCSLREMGLDALCCFRNDSHLSCHRRKMLCPVVFTFERIDYFEERPYIFGNDSWFQNDSLLPKTLEILSFSKDR